MRRPCVRDAVTVALFAMLSASSGATAEPSVLAERLESVVRTFLGHNHNLRLVTRADCRCERALARKRQANAGYEPFTATGDFNGDGKVDMAILFYDRRWYAYSPGVLAIFNGPLSAKSRPAFMRGDLPLVGTGLSVAAGRLTFGRIGAKGCAYRPFRRGYREDCSVR